MIIITLITGTIEILNNFKKFTNESIVIADTYPEDFCNVILNTP